jgi:hypothetical protein
MVLELGNGFDSKFSKEFNNTESVSFIINI